MRSLADIRSGQPRKNRKQEAPTQEATVSQTTKVLLGVSDEKRKELNLLNDEIEVKKKEVQIQGESLIIEAQKKADLIIRKAKATLTEATSLQNAVITQHQALDGLYEQVKQSLDEVDRRQVASIEKEKHLVSIQEQILSHEKGQNKAILQSQTILYELTGLIMASLTRLESIEAVDTLGKKNLRATLDSLNSLLSTLTRRHLEQEAKEEYLDVRDKQIAEKQAILKEQRTQLRMATKEYGK